MKLNDIIQFLLSKNIRITLVNPVRMPSGARKVAEEEFSDVTVWHGIGGFYKSDCLYICENADSIFILDRYGSYTDLLFNKSTVNDVITELCRENVYWWKVTCERNLPGTIAFDSDWLPLLVERGLVKAVVETRYVVV